MNPDMSDYRLWGLALISSAVFIVFASSCFKPRTRTSSRTLRAFSCVVSIALALASASAALGEETLDLEALVREALTSHPAVLESERSLAAAAERPSQAGSLPDPVLSVSLQNVPISDFSLDASPMSALQVGVLQAVPFPGKLGRREDVAQGLARFAARDLEQTQTLIARNVRILYWSLHFAERAEQITFESEQLLGTLADIVHERFQVGQAAQQDALQVQVAHSRVRTDLAARRQALISARRELSAAVGRDPTDSLAPTRAPADELGPVDRTQAATETESANPALTVSRARLEVAKRQVREARWDRWPDFHLAAGYRIREVVPGDPSMGADQFSATLALTLPVWARGKQNARVRETEEAEAVARHSVRKTDLDVMNALERTVDAIERFDEELHIYEREILPQAELALDASIEDYQVAKVGFVSVLQNWEAWLNARIAFERLRMERAQHYAAVQALRGPEKEMP